MNCEKFRNQFTVGLESDAGLNAHFSTCPECQAFAAEEERLSEMFSVLEKRDAPIGFGQAVRSRIDTKKRPAVRIWGYAKVYVPVAAVALVIGFVYFNSGLFTTEFNSEGLNAKTGVADTVKEKVKNTVPATEQSDSTEIAEADKPEIDTVAKIQKEPKQENVHSVPRARAEQESSVRAKIQKPVLESVDMSFEESEIENPPGIEPDKKVVIAPQGPKQKFTAKEILSTLGIAAEWRGSRLVVTSVTDNSIAATSGVRIGDRVLYIDGKAIGVKTFSRGSVSGRVITVRREGKDLRINLNNPD